MPQYLDISQPIFAGMAVYPGNPEVQLSAVRTAKGGESALTRIALGSHTGTHIDAPSHVLPQGAGTAAYSWGQLIGPARVIELLREDVIGAEDLPAAFGERVLIKTRNSGQDPQILDETFVALNESAAQELARRGVKLVGIDGPSIKKRGVKDRVHEILLEAGIVIIEGLRLTQVEPGAYELICLPLPVDLDGAPVRAVLRR